MADGDVALQRAQLFLIKDLGDQAHLFVQIGSQAVRHSDPRALLSSVLKSIQPKEGDAGYGLTSGIDAKDAASLSRPINEPCAGH
jgi:hypothetical protein